MDDRNSEKISPCSIFTLWKHLNCIWKIFHVVLIREDNQITYFKWYILYSDFIFLVARAGEERIDRSESVDARILSYSILIRGNDHHKTNQRGIIPRNSFSRLPSGRSFLFHPPESGDEKRKISENQAQNRIPRKTTLTLCTRLLSSLLLFIKLSGTTLARQSLCF